MYLVVLMKVAKLKKVNKTKKEIELEEVEFSIKKLIQTIVIILLVLAVFYIITVFVVKPIVAEKNNEHVQFDTTKITMNQLLTRKEDSYYVLAVKESAYLNLYTTFNYFELYNNYIKQYTAKENALKFYWIDMDDAFNASHWSDDLDINNYIINDDVLFKVSNGSLSSYYVGHEEILRELQGI